MEKNYCFHCGHEIEKNIEHCPQCHAPMQLKKVNSAEKNAHKFKYYFIALVLFCFAVIYLAPRVIPSN